ncbi:paladin-like isoform X3 [Actinia tenebrosa]|uniref:Paladin-like isoform X3 n=1 Tax=Actinia tenebrosa TaxID=6105 RepID=A0A6P8J444_ACTTE|nr:paladin-like isoform X3 [Actinia tenebrosa]
MPKFKGAFRCFDMGSAASSVGSPPGSSPSLHQQHQTTPIHTAVPINTSKIRKGSTAPMKKQSNGFIVLSYAPTNTPLVRKRGKIKTGFPEHGLIQDKYFLIRDHFNGIDRLNTLETCGAPNFRKAGGSYPVYGMGQPSKDGLALVIETLICNGHKEIVSFNLREEPVIFLSLNHDYIPYSPRDPGSLKGNIANYGVKPEELADTEIKIREEIIKLSVEEGGKFYFYNDVEKFDDEPHAYNISYEENVCVMDEIYSRQIFLTPFLRFCRVPITATNAPEEQDFDQFINAVKDIPQVFDTNSSAPLPAMVFNCHVGQGRTTTGMVIGCLIMCHRSGFPAETSSMDPIAMDENNPNYEKGEFRLIQQLVKSLPNGLKIKQEVDSVIDICADMTNIRMEIVECRKKLQHIDGEEEIEGQNGRIYWLKRGISYLERYFFLIIFNAYLHEQFPLVFSQTFCKWMRHRPWLYRMLSHIDVMEKGVTSEFFSKLNEPTCLVADEYLGIDVLSTQREVQVSNFRKVPGLPVYGMSQPAREGLAKVIELLTDPKYSHPKVVVFNVREDVAIECDGDSFSQRELGSLAQHIPYKGLQYFELERMESELKHRVTVGGQTTPVQVYMDIKDAYETRQFKSVLTMREMHENQMEKTPCLVYYRLPVPKMRIIEEKDLDRLMSIINSLNEIHTDEDGPALVFFCESGRERSTTAMTVASLIYCNKKGFPVGTKPDEQDPACVPNAKYTLGEFSVIRHLIRVLPDGPQRKREVDYVLDKISETMTPMHYHAREVIFSTFQKYKHASPDCPEHKMDLRKQSLYCLERYFYLIIFNTYLHMERRTKWKRTFCQWMTQVASAAGVYDILDNFGFHDFEKTEERLQALRWRWRESFRGKPG